MTRPKNALKPQHLGSLRHRIMAELAKHADGAMAADLAVWIDANGNAVRKALGELVAIRRASKRIEHMRGGGGKGCYRFFAGAYPPPLPPAAPNAAPASGWQPWAPEVRFADLGPGRYIDRDTAVQRAYGRRP